MISEPINVIATTISGSIKDWAKVDKIVPLFKTNGRDDVTLHVVDSHAAARSATQEIISGGHRLVISAGGSGTFNSILEGCIDTGVPISEITLGFLRKGSADLIGKALGMPDDIEKAIEVFADSLQESRTVKCDVIRATSDSREKSVRHFVGYGGGEIFGKIPHYTENRLTKYYKGVLSQLFGDLGPFFVGASLAVLEKLVETIRRRKRLWRVVIDGREEASGYFQAMIIVNGDLGPDLPFARAVPLGSGNFYLYLIRDLGFHRVVGQFRHAWDASILEMPERWGFESYCVEKLLEIHTDQGIVFPMNIDGSTMRCEQYAEFSIVDQINLLAGPTSLQGAP